MEMLWYILSRVRRNIADIIYFNWTTTFAQSNDIVSKTAYNGTVTDNVTIGSDGDGSSIDVNATVITTSWFSTAAFSWLEWNQATISFSFKSHIANYWSVYYHFLTKSANNNFNFYLRNNTIFSTFKQSDWTVIWTSLGAFVVDVLMNITVTIKDGFIYHYKNGVLVDTKAFVWNIFPYTGNWMSFWKYPVWCSLYYLRCYSWWMTSWEIATEITLWQKQTARKDCVLEILPQYFALPAAPTTVYDSVGNNNGTVTWALAVSDNSFVFDTTAKYITLTTPQTFAWECTICGWFNYTGGSTLTKMFLWNNLWAWTRAKIWNVNNGKLFVRVIDWWSSTNWLSVPSWNFFFCLTRDSSNKIDVTLNTTKTRIFSDVAQVGNIAYDIIGKDESASYWGGNVYWVSFYNRAISDSEVTEIYNAWRDVRTPVTSWLVAEYRPSPSTIYDVKAFTPATPVVIQTTFQLGADGVNTALSQPLVQTPYRYGHIRTTLNALVMRKDWPWFASDTYQIGNWNRSTHTAVLTAQILNWSIVTTVFIDGVKVDTDTSTTLTRTKYTDYLQIGRVLNGWTWLYTWQISNTKVYIWTITDTEWVAMSSWIPVIPANATLLTFPKRAVPYSTTLTDTSWNWYDFTLTL